MKRSNTFRFNRNKGSTERNFVEELNIKDNMIQEIYFHYCPRLIKWSHRSIHSVLHPNISTTVQARKTLERRLTSDNLTEIEVLDSPRSRSFHFNHHHNTKSSLALSFRSFQTQSRNEYRNNILLITNQIHYMSPEDKFALLSQLYDKQAENEATEAIIDEVTENLTLHYPFEIAVGKWWDAMTNKSKDLIDRSSYFNVFVKLYDLLVPYSWIVGPVDKVSAIQSDFRTDCEGLVLGVSYERFITVMLELCENWVNTCDSVSPMVQNFDLELDVEELGGKYGDFLKDLYFKIFVHTHPKRNIKLPRIASGGMGSAGNSNSSPHLLQHQNSQNLYSEITQTRETHQEAPTQNRDEPESSSDSEPSSPIITCSNKKPQFQYTTNGGEEDERMEKITISNDNHSPNSIKLPSLIFKV